MNHDPMTTRLSTGLSALQVATLLVSASYGIGFLFGSGEVALQWGMAGSIYAMVTALGIAVLAFAAPQLWRSGLQIWQVLGSAYGAKVSTLVALLSVVWMSGVLAAQIHGGVAVVKLMGLPTLAAYALMLVLIFAASRMHLALAAKVFAMCLAASSLLLLYALFSVDGVPVFSHAVPSFAADLPRIPWVRLWVIILAIAPLVVTGADYQQFVMAAKSSRAAVLGSLMAAGFLCLFGFVPAAVVVAYQSGPTAVQPASGNQIMPFIMAGVAQRLAAGYEWVVLAGLLTAALGSAAAIVRAMSAAALSAIGSEHRPGVVNLAMVLLGGLIASRGQAIIDTMVALNMVYLGAIGVVFVALLMRWQITAQGAWWAMLAGLAASLIGYLLGWAGLTALDADLLSLVAGVLASLLVVGWYAAAARLRLVDPASGVRVP
jgi:SSS family solute:Na+ symporter